MAAIEHTPVHGTENTYTDTGTRQQAEESVPGALACALAAGFVMQDRATVSNNCCISGAQRVKGCDQKSYLPRQKKLKIKKLRWTII